jgi:hypothetical protein
MKSKTIITLFIFSLLGLQGCVTQAIGAAVSTTVAVVTIPVKLGVAATNIVIDSVTDGD